MNKQAIGVFDSGLGGLTILSALHKRLPNEDLIYFGDTANVPYGSKSKTAVTRFSLAIARFLQEQGVKLIVVACNTASALALAELRKQISIPVIGVIESGAEKAVRSTKNGKIAVLGTEATIKSRAYPKAVLKRNKTAEVFQQACPLFVPLVEENWAQTPVARLTAKTYLASVIKSGADTVILGCTHYPVLKPVIAGILGKRVTMVDSSDTLAEAVEHLLVQSGQAAPKRKGRLTVFASDDPKRFKRLAGCLLSGKTGAVRLKKLNV